MGALKYIVSFVFAFFWVSSAYSSDVGWQSVAKNNTSKLSSYLDNKDCVAARSTLLKNGWLPFPTFQGEAFNRDAPMFEEVEDMFIKYPELEHCFSTGAGTCSAGYKKGKFLLKVEYGSAEGGFGFEEKICQANAYKVVTRD